jgi:hypothetical protein
VKPLEQGLDRLRKAKPSGVGEFIHNKKHEHEHGPRDGRPMDPNIKKHLHGKHHETAPTPAATPAPAATPTSTVDPRLLEQLNYWENVYHQEFGGYVPGVPYVPS